MPQPILKELVDHPRIKYFGKGISLSVSKFRFAFHRRRLYIFLIADAGLYFNAVQHLFHNAGIAADRNPLMGIVKIIVVIGKSKRQSFDNKSRQLFAVPPPLFLRITFDKFLVHISSCQRKRLLFQIPGLINMKRFDLSRDFRFRLFRRYNTPHFTESVHVKRKIVQFLMVPRYRRVDVMIERCKLSDVIPYFLIRCVENMCAIFMNIDIQNRFRINVAGNVFSSVNHKYPSASFVHLICEHRPEQSGADDQIIVPHHCSAA